MADEIPGIIPQNAQAIFPTEVNGIPVTPIERAVAKVFVELYKMRKAGDIREETIHVHSLTQMLMQMLIEYAATLPAWQPKL